MDKKELRKKYISVRKNIPEDRRAEESKTITDKLSKLLNNGNYTSLLMYAPKEYEVDILGLFDSVNGIPVYFPRCDKDEMDFYKVDDLSKLRSGCFGVREPDESCEIFVPRENEKYLIVVPGTAFDRDGYRIGYGKGFYDKYLSRYAEYDFHKAGVCFTECMTDDVLHDGFDVKMNEVIF